MNRYLLFGYDTYYSSGPERDFKGGYDDLVSMVDVKLSGENKCDNWVYLDTQTGIWNEI